MVDNKVVFPEFRSFFVLKPRILCGGIVVAIAFITGFGMFSISTPSLLLSPSPTASTISFNATTFWDTEVSRVESTPLNISIVSQNITLHGGQEFNRTDLDFDVPNWVGASPACIRVRATLFTPTNSSGMLSRMPGVILMHGTGQNRHQYLNTGLSYAKLNCTVLVLDLVGHGESDGPKPDASHTVFQDDFNKTSYHYLAFCNGLQAVRVMRSLATLVDESRIAISGHSLGGMTAMVVSAIYHDKIALVFPSGMMNITRTFPETAILNLVNLTYDQYLALPTSTWQWINPLNYMAVARYPACCPFVGTNDEYFAYEGIADTWTVLQNSMNGKWLQVTQNGHHKYPSSRTPHYLLEHVLFGGPAPPAIEITGTELEPGIMERFRVDVNIESAAGIASVELCYKYKDITGEPWRSVPMTGSVAGLWTGSIETPWISSHVACFVKVTLDAGDTVWFTSTVMEAGMLCNELSFLPMAGIILSVVIPVYLLLIDRYRFEVNALPLQVQRRGKAIFVAENLVIGGTEAVKFTSMSWAWLNYGPTLPWSLTYIMNAYFTYEGAFKDFAYYFNAIIIAAFLAILVASFANPLLSGLMNAAWPALFYLLASMLASALGTTISAQMLGPGYFVFLVVAIMQIATWVIKRLYHKKLGIPARTLLTMLKSVRPSRMEKKVIAEAVP